MSWSDPIADMLTRIRNAHMSKREMVEMPFSRLKGEIAKVFKREGYIADFAIEGGVKKTLRIFLKYSEDQEPAIRGLERKSKPGRRVYAAADELPSVLSGLGVAVVSTSAGVMTDKEAQGKRLGGEVLCMIW